MIHGPIEVEMIKFYCLSTPKRNKILRQYSFVFWIFFPEEIAEFLDSWLMLIERMSNPKTILETPHVMPSKSSQTGYVPFSAVQYLIKAQKVGAPSL